MITNVVKTGSGTVTVSCSSGHEIILDAEDVGLLKAGRISSVHTRHKWPYIMFTKKGTRKAIRLARVILSVTDPAECVQHNNGNPLDHRRSNLSVKARGTWHRDRPIMEGTMLIRTKRGDIKVDDTDAQLLSSYTVSVAIRKKDGYLVAVAYPRGSVSHSGTTLGRIIMDAKEGDFIDHVNHDTLDNRRVNLRICSYEQNCWNTRPRSRCGFKGVTQVKGPKGAPRWRALLSANGERYYLGVHETPEQAARAFDNAAKKYHGGFACLNFPDETPNQV